jgi:hypothetical protein
MRKYTRLMMASTLLFALSMFAQSSSQNPATQNSGTAAQSSGSSTSSTDANQNPSGAQTSMPSSTSSSPSASSNATQSASGSQNSANNSASGQEETMEGCLVKEQTDYFVQPVSGSRMRLRADNQDLSGYVGQDVRIHGRHWNPNAQNNENSSQASSQPSGAPVTGAVATNKGNQAGEQFEVSKVDVVSATCPTNGAGTPH